MTESETVVPIPRDDIKDVFLCHNGADKDWVEMLAEQIESETIDGQTEGRRLSVFFDKWDIGPGDNFLARINTGLTRARFLAIVLSPNMLAAPWPNLEWTAVQALDPMNAGKRLIPLLLKGNSAAGIPIDIPPTLRVCNWIDFRDIRHFNQSFIKLITHIRGLPPQRGRPRKPLAMLSCQPAPSFFPEETAAATPDGVSELMLGNLIPITKLPMAIFDAECHKAGATAKDIVDAEGRQRLPAFILRGSHLYSFCDLASASSPFTSASIRVGTINKCNASEWMTDQDKSKWYVSLLNESIKQELIRKQIFKDLKGRYYFAPIAGEDRNQRTQQGNRAVASRKTTKDGGCFWVHHAARLSFLFLGNRCFLMIDPCYVFTKDGREPITGKSLNPLNLQWAGRERNAAILRHILFWMHVVGKTIETGGYPIELGVSPAACRNEFGISSDKIMPRALVTAHGTSDELDLAAKNFQREGI